MGLKKRFYGIQRKKIRGAVSVSDGEKSGNQIALLMNKGLFHLLSLEGIEFITAFNVNNAINEYFSN